MRRWALAAVNAALTLAGIFLAFHARDWNERWAALACIAFFGGGQLMLFINIVNRGPRAAPAPPLRFDDDATTKHVDRLELPVSGKRVALVITASLFFCVAGGVGLMLGGRIAGTGIAIASAAFAVTGVVFTLRLAGTTPIVFELDRVIYERPFRLPLTMRYDAIRTIQTVELSGQSFVGFDVFDLEEVLAECSPGQRKTVRSSMLFTGCPFVLPNTVVPNAEQLAALLAFYTEFNRRNGMSVHEKKSEPGRLDAYPEKRN